MKPIRLNFRKRQEIEARLMRLTGEDRVRDRLRDIAAGNVRGTKATPIRSGKVVR